MLYVGTLAAQQLQGKLLDQHGAPLEDVGIFNRDSGSHGHSDGRGDFLLGDCSPGDTVVFSLLGHRTLTQVLTAVDLQGPIRVVLEESAISLEQVVLLAQRDVLTQVVEVDVQADPVKSSQEILRKVPGLIIGQHAGGGKAEQLFLRGFDVDHGTDVAISVDGLPVNMVSHAHGQGYADLHFVIPETLATVDFGKGPYFAEQGNFNTAGFVDLGLRRSLDRSLLSTELGMFGTRRFMGMFKVLDSGNSNAYLASELYLTDGPFDSPQDFNRTNIMGRYRYALPGEQELILTASHFSSTWNASGQIPQRAIDRGMIGRFGAIDDTEGGQTGRSNFVVHHNKNLGEGRSLATMAYVSTYDFHLFSNFTFFLEDPEHGDQIEQREDRTILGAKTVFRNSRAQWGGLVFQYRAGLGFRHDRVDGIQLSHTVNRSEILERLAHGDVEESNVHAFGAATFKSGKFTFEPALRLDHFKFDYRDRLSELYAFQSKEKLAFSPKFNTRYSPSAHTQLFLKAGMGFHSNDSRVVVAQGGEEILPPAYGVDLGVVVRPMDRLVLNATLWSLFLDQEFVYVGDAGIVEPSGKTRRMGIELGARYQPLDWIYFHTDANYTHARSLGEAEGEDHIPLAPDLTLVGGVVLGGGQGLSGSLNYRFVDDRPANEDNSIVAEGYFVADATLNYTVGDWTFGVIVENLLDTAWNETQFATESRLRNEPGSVEEIHFTPGMPFYLRGKVSISF